MKRNTVIIFSVLALIMCISLAVILAVRLEWFQRETPPKEPKEVEEKADTKLAKQIVVEQQQSRVSLRRLAEGEVEAITIGNVDKNNNRATAEVAVYYMDDSEIKGTADFIHQDGKWYLTKIQREYDPSASPKKARSVEDVTKSETELGKRMVAEQKKYQDLVVDMVNGSIESIDIDKIDNGPDKAIITATITYTGGRTVGGTVKLEYVGGYWYLLKLEVE